MDNLYTVRKSYGDVYVTVFDEGLTIPWRPLSLGDYIKYTEDRERGFIPIACLEDEIFRKCVLDQSILRQMDHLKAGIISTVVINIWQFSGPSNVDEFNEDLEISRQILNNDSVRALHDLVQIITIAFPYKPEDVYAMDYKTFLFRLAQSEKKLLQLGLYIQEPIKLETEKKHKPKSKLGQIEQNRVDAKALWDQQQKQQKVSINDVQQSGEKWWNKSPVLESVDKHHINFREEAAEQYAFGLTGHEKADIAIETAKLVEDARWIYKDLLGELEKRKKG